ncbi:cardiolipin synthase (CMP-forming)-like [Montipora foliosa]|uniref:cardiolipin synthase (CMP-forming)-like n=1 Tax=Montipora foliosa TaxID=591990 RepID=UPI0035F1FD81
MASACLSCTAFRLNFISIRCFKERFSFTKLKNIMPTGVASSLSFVSYRCFCKETISGHSLSLKGQKSVFNIQKSRHISGSLSLLHRDTGEAKVRGIKIKAKIEQMKEMKEDIFTVPNLLSTLRILSTPVLGYLILTQDFVSSMALFGVAGITDLLDGYIARNFRNQKSVLGTILDPLADKILISVLTVSLTMVSLLPVPLTALILSRDALLVSYAFYLRFKSLPSPKSLSRYFDVNFPTVELRPNLLGKANTVLQLALVGCSLAAPVAGFVDHPYLHYLWYTVACSTILSSINYVIYFKESVKYLK